MNPFEHPPTTPPVVASSQPELPSGGSGRGRMALVALLTAGLIGGGLIGISQFASADRPEVEPEPAASAQTGDEGDRSDDESDDGDDTDLVIPEIEGEIVIDDGDGDPIVIDLGELGGEDGTISELIECVGLPMFEGGEFDFDDIPMGEWLEGDTPFDLEDFEQIPWGEVGSQVTVTGPDGVTIIDLGDGDGSVTITQNDGEISIATDGDATVSELEDLFGDFEDHARQAVHLADDDALLGGVEKS